MARISFVHFLIGSLVVATLGVFMFNRSASQGQDRLGDATFSDGSVPKLFASEPALEFSWPPRLNETFPDLELRSSTGDIVRLSDFHGKVVLVEPVGMTCAACNAFSGARERGGYKHITPQANLPSIEKLLPQYAGGTSLDDERIVLVQLLLYDMKLRAPSLEDARDWAAHFGFDDNPSVIVLVGDERFINRASYDMIPGFFLLDKNRVLRADATGHQPRHNLFTELLKRIPDYLVANEVSDYAAYEPEEFDLSLSVADAYRAIPHQQTTFDANGSRIAGREQRFIEELFRLTDFAVAERVQSLQWYLSGGMNGARPSNYEALIGRLAALPAPDRLRPVKKLIGDAIEEQARYFSTQDETSRLKFNARDKRVQNSHHKLVNAYNLLMARYPEESAHNKKAFFDHLCALDFI